MFGPIKMGNSCNICSYREEDKNLEMQLHPKTSNYSHVEEEATQIEDLQTIKRASQRNHLIS